MKRGIDLRLAPFGPLLSGCSSIGSLAGCGGSSDHGASDIGSPNGSTDGAQGALAGQRR